MLNKWAWCSGLDVTALGKWKMTGPWDSLVSKLQASERPCLKREGDWLLRKDTHIHAHPCGWVHIYTEDTKAYKRNTRSSADGWVQAVSDWEGKVVGWMMVMEFERCGCSQLNYNLVPMSAG